ncbi:MAG: hypothetical protein V3S24_04280 [Candidatus Tectomicrobia bacterium]
MTRHKAGCCDTWPKKIVGFLPYKNVNVVCPLFPRVACFPGGVAVQNLDEKEKAGDNWLEAALTPLVVGTTTGRHDGVGFELSRPIWCVRRRPGRWTR